MRKELVPGVKVEVVQQIPHRDRVWTNTVVGTIVAYEQRQTGSWFAHARSDKLWLDRLILRKADGEVTTLNLDEYSVVKVLGPGSIEQAQPPASATGEPVIK